MGQDPTTFEAWLGGEGNRKEEGSWEGEMRRKAGRGG